MNSTPPPQSCNRYSCLSVEEIDESSTDEPDCVKAVQKINKPKGEFIQRASWEKRLLRKYVIASTSENSLNIDVEIEIAETSIKRRTNAIVDSGATGLFMDSEYVCQNAISTRQLSSTIPVFNVDGSPNEAGEIREVADVILRYDGHAECAQFAVTQLGKQNMILGYTWLRDHNPEVDWQEKTVWMSRCPPRCDTCHLQEKRMRTIAAQISACHAGDLPELVEDVDDEEGGAVDNLEAGENVRFTKALKDLLCDNILYSEVEDGDRIFAAHIHPERREHVVRATSTVSQRLAEAFAKNSDKPTFRDLVPESLHDFEDVFNKESFDSLPERRKWDHAIELESDPKPGFHKVYPMSLEEQGELDEFLDEALSTGRIRVQMLNKCLCIL